MAAGDTGVSICSDALILLGAKAISSFNDGTDEANACDRLYPDIRDSTLVMYPWRFSLKKVELAQLIDAPTSSWRYAYQLPGDRLAAPRLVRESASVGEPVFKEWEIQGDQLLANIDTIFIDYQYQPGEFAWPQYFVQLMKYMMAWHLAEPITEQRDKSVFWQQIAQGFPAENGRGGYMRTAMHIDGGNNPAYSIDDFSLIAARF